MTKRVFKICLTASVITFLIFLFFRDYSQQTLYTLVGEITNETEKKIEFYLSLRTASDYEMVLTASLTFFTFALNAIKKHSIPLLSAAAGILLVEIGIAALVSLWRINSPMIYSEVFIFSSWFWVFAGITFSAALVCILLKHPQTGKAKM